MSHRLFRRIGLLALVGLLIGVVAFSRARAHNVTMLGDYMVQFRWLHEPALVNQPNAVVLTINKVQATAAEDDGGQPTSPLPTPVANATPGATFLLPITDTVLTSADVKVNVQLTGIDENNSNSYHWHLYLDGQLQIMSGVMQTSYILPNVKPGAHVLTATLSGVDHVDLGTVAVRQFQVNPTAADAASNPQAATDEATASGGPGAAGLELTVLLEHEGATQVLYLEPSAQPGSNEYSARLTPTRAGRYVLRFQGNVQGEPVDIASQIEAVQSSDLLHYLQTFFTVPNLATLPLAYWLTLVITGFGIFTLLLGILILGAG